MSDRTTEAEQEADHEYARPSIDGSTIERYVRTHAERNSKGINIDATVSVRVTMPLSIHPESARYLIKDELSGLQQIADDHLAARLSALSQS